MKKQEYIQRYCKNCGAPLEHGYNHHCKYCGTLYDFNEPKDKVVELHSWDLVDVNFVGVEQEPCCRRLLFKFQGYKLESPKIYEYDGDTYVSKAIDYINPPKAGFIISMDIDDLEQHGISYLQFMLHNYIRPTEQKNIERQIGEIISQVSRYCYIGGKL